MTGSARPSGVHPGPVPASLTAPAKLTLGLRVTGVRPDGYHLIDAEMVTLDLVDRLEIRPHVDESEPALALDGPTSAGLAPGPDNLVSRALVLVGAIGAAAPAVRLTKCIPAGGGLGGGSADAAAILRWAGFDDVTAAARLGADVPFCIRGGRARVTGIGDRLEPLPFVERPFTLALNGVHCDTAAVYRAWDGLGGPTADGPNDLEPAALAVAPELARHRDALGDATGAEPVLAGSGSTWFVEGAHPGPGRLVVTTTPGHTAPG